MQYVIVKHSHKTNPTHWDLMLEIGDKLRTYRIDIPPQHFTDQPIQAHPINDHPLKFLTYQGPVNNEQGSVTQADKGNCQISKETQTQLHIIFKGNLLNGTFVFSISK